MEPLIYIVEDDEGVCEVYEGAKAELRVLSKSVSEILTLSLSAFADKDLELARKIEPLEEVIDELKEQLRARHIYRLQEGRCTIAAGFVWSDILTNLERTADHCSNIAGCILEMANHDDLKLHEYLGQVKRTSPAFIKKYEEYLIKHQL